jgi:hypothetical protein
MDEVSLKALVELTNILHIADFLAQNTEHINENDFENLLMFVEDFIYIADSVQANKEVAQLEHLFSLGE